jgi:hypothetical protein
MPAQALRLVLNQSEVSGMDFDDAAADQQAAALAAQMTLCGMSDNPGQFRGPAMSALFRQAWRGAVRAPRRELHGDAVLARTDGWLTASLAGVRELKSQYTPRSRRLLPVQTHACDSVNTD